MTFASILGSLVGRYFGFNVIVIVGSVIAAFATLQVDLLWVVTDLKLQRFLIALAVAFTAHDVWTERKKRCGEGE